MGKGKAEQGFRDPSVARVLADGRLWLRHGPIEIFARAEGEAAEVAAAYRQGAARFGSVLGEVAAELAVLRRPVRGPRLAGIPGRMQEVCEGIEVFVTPMAAVAGTVAEAVLAAMRRGRRLARVFVNNGGDIALWRGAGAPFRVGVVTDLATGASPGWIEVPDEVGGLATSGWPGRSHSLGIADAVTVLAREAAMADLAATLVANAVDLPGHSCVVRVPARDLAPDSDLGPRAVTRAVAPLSGAEIAAALDRGEATARDLILRGRIHSAILALQGTLRLVGPVTLHPFPRGPDA